MSLAWTTVVLLILLLPGFLFFVGLYSPERISRDKVQDSALGRLAGVVLISFLTHSLGFGISSFLCEQVRTIPCISMQYVFAALQLVGAKKYSLAHLGSVFDSNLHWIFLYVISTAGLGYAAGWTAGQLILQGWLWFRTFARHGWIYDVAGAHKDGELIHAYVLTNIQRVD